MHQSATGSSTNLRETPVVEGREKRRIWRYWSFSFFALSIASALLISIIVILVKYDGQQLPHWPFSININTLVALLSTIYRASIVVVLADIIGQAKWAWFREKPRPLKQLQIYDDASRGVWGSFRLIQALRFGARGNPLALIAAFTTILSLAVGPFAQQAVKTTTCTQTMASESGTISVANTVPGTDSYYRIGAGMWELGPGMKGAMVNAVTAPSTKGSIVEHSCPSGNCTFPRQNDIPYSTVAMCSKCMDMTSLVEVQEPPSDTYPSNLTLGTLTVNEIGGSDWLVSGNIDLGFAEAHMSDEFRDLSSQSMSNITILTISEAPCQGKDGCPHKISPQARNDYVAATCTLYPCMRNFRPKVESGSLVEEIVSEEPARVNGVDFSSSMNPAQSEYIAIKQPCVVENEIYDVGNFSLVPNKTDVRAFRNSKINGENVSVPTDCYYTFSGIYVFALRAFVDESLLKGNCSWQSAQGGSINCGDEWWLSTLWSQNKATFETLHGAINNWTDAVTNFLRSDGYGPLNVTADDVGISNAATDMIEGLVHETTVCMSLDWPWLVMPGLLCLLTILLLAATLVLNHTQSEQAVWQSNILPLLFFGLEYPGSKSVEHPSEDWSDIVDVSSRMMVRLQKNELHRRPAFVPVVAESPSEDNEMESISMSTYRRTDTISSDDSKW